MRFCVVSLFVFSCLWAAPSCAGQALENYTPPPMFGEEALPKDAARTPPPLTILDDILPRPAPTTNKPAFKKTALPDAPFARPPVPPKRPKSFKLSRAVLEKLMAQNNAARGDTRPTNQRAEDTISAQFDADYLGGQIIEMDADDIYRRLNEE